MFEFTNSSFKTYHLISRVVIVGAHSGVEVLVIQIVVAVERVEVHGWDS